jgi:hypothetical protein
VKSDVCRHVAIKIATCRAHLVHQLFQMSQVIGAAAFGGQTSEHGLQVASGLYQILKAAPPEHQAPFDNLRQEFGGGTRQIRSIADALIEKSQETQGLQSFANGCATYPEGHGEVSFGRDLVARLEFPGQEELKQTLSDFYARPLAADGWDLGKRDGH